MNPQARNNESQRMHTNVDEDRQALRELTNELSKQWRRAIGGFIALPSAFALGVASAAMYVGLFVELGFQAFERVADTLQEERREDWRRPPEESREQPREQPRA
jgi:hypothetical protein